MERSPNRLDWPHWQALLAAGLRDTETHGLPAAVHAYLLARWRLDEPAQWRAFGNGWSQMAGDERGQLAKQHLLAPGEDAAEPLLRVARLQVLVEAREPGAPLVLPQARALLEGWAGEYSKFGLSSAGGQLLDVLAEGLADWLGAALARKPWPAASSIGALVGVAAAHARWLGQKPLTAVCFPFGPLVQLLQKAAPGAPELGAAAADYAAALGALVLVESSERRRRDQWVEKLRAVAAVPPAGPAR
ncbi:hypothetical protein D621_02405 [beta proteobacterium AAP51]|nr:hypothetical protein D621_02405 [beta proteobacterium AAP51]